MTRARRRRLILVGAAGLVALVALLAFRLGLFGRWRTTPEERALEAKVNAALRVLCYPVTVDRPLTVLLRPDDGELKVLSNLELPAGASLDLRTEYVYGLRVSFLDGSLRELGAEAGPSAATYWEKTRKTRLREPGDLVDREEAFLTDTPSTPADTRATHVLVRGLVDRGAKYMRLSLDPSRPMRLVAPGDPGLDGPSRVGPLPLPGARPAERVYIRCLRGVELSEAEALERWAKLDERAREEALREVNLYRSDLVSEAERVALMRRRWEAMPAEAVGGREHPTIHVYFTRFFQERSPPRDDLLAAPAVGPRQALALNVVGPCNLYVEAEPEVDIGAPGPRGEGPRLLEVLGLREEGIFLSRRERLAAVGGSPSHLLHIPVPPGPASFQVRPLNFRGRVSFYLDRLVPLEGVEVSRVVKPVGESRQWMEVVPESARTNYYSTRPSDAPPVDAEVLHPRANEATEVRLSVRVPFAPGDADVKLVRLRVDLEDADGRPLERRTLTGEAERSFFDGYWRAEEPDRGVSEPVLFTLRCEPAVRRLRVSAEERYDVAFFSRLRRAEEVTLVPEDYPLAPEIRASEIRSGRFRPQVWFYFRPSNHDRLAAAGRELGIVSQRRLFELRERAQAALEVSNFARALEPLDPRGALDIIEPGPLPDPGRPVLAGAGVLFEVRPQAPATLEVANRVDPGNPRPVTVSLRYVRAPEAPPRERLVSVYVDGRKRLAAVLAGPSAEIGDLELDAVPTGRRLFLVEVFARPSPDAPFEREEPAGLRVFADQPNRTGEERGAEPPAPPPSWLERRIYPLAADGLAFEVVKPGPDAVQASFVLFGPPQGDIPVRDDVLVEVARVAPNGGSQPVETRAFSVLRAGAHAFSGPGPALGEGRRVYMPLRSELEPGPYRLTLRRAPKPGASTGDPLFARLSVLDPTRHEIGRTRFARLNIKGPATLMVVVRPAPPPGESAPPQELKLLVKVLTPRAPAPLEERPVVIGPNGEGTLRIETPEGLATVIVGSLAETGVPARFSIAGYLDRLAGHAAVHVPPTLAEAEALEILPDVGEEVVHRAMPGDPLRYDLRGGPAGAELVRLRVSTPLASPREGEEMSLAVRLRFLGADGAELAGHEATAPATFHRAAFFAAPATGVPSEPADLYAVPPAGAAALEVDGPLPLDVSAAVEAAGRVRRGSSPEDPKPPPGLRVADGVHPDDRFEPLPPARAADLARAGRRRVLFRPRQRIREVEEPEPTAGAAISLAPAQYETRGKLLEPVPPAAVPPPEAWSESLFVEVGGGERLPFEFVDLALVGPSAGTPPEEGAVDPASPGTVGARVYYDLGPGAVPESPVQVLLDDHVLLAPLLLETRGALSLPEVPTGRRELRFEAARGSRFFVNRPVAAPPAAPRPVFRERGVYRLAPGKPAVIELEKPADRDLILTVGVYLPEGVEAPTAVDVRVVAGPPARRPGVFLDFTPLLRRHTLLDAPAVAAIDLDVFAPARVRAHRLFVPLKADLAPGRVSVELSLRDAPAALLRFVVVRPDVPVVERVRLKSLRLDR